MIDSRFGILFFCVLIFWILGVWWNRSDVSSTRFRTSHRLASIFGSKDDRLDGQTVSYQLGVLSVLLYDTLARISFPNWPIQFSFILGGITTLCLQYAFRQSR